MYSRFKLLLILLTLSFANSLAMEVKIFNVGQGNCTVIAKPGEATVILDAGSSQEPHEENITGLKDTIIESIADYVVEKNTTNGLFVIASHPDKDHINWLPPIAQKVKQKKKEITFTTLLGGTQTNYKTQIAKNVCTELKELSGAQFHFADKITTKAHEASATKKHLALPSYCKILANNPNAPNPNDQSIVLKADDGQHSILLPGDATQKITGTLDAICKSTYYVLSHHGAETEGATTLPLLIKVNPSWIAISSGMYGGFLHPRFGVIKTVMEYFGANQLLNGTHWHSFNFANQAGNEADPNGMSTIISYQKNGFKTAITQAPIATTANAGNIIFNSEWVQFDSEGEELSARRLAINCLRRSYFKDFNFNTIKVLNFSKLQLLDSHIAEVFTVFPQALVKADFSDNPELTRVSILTLLMALKTHAQEAKITLKILYSRAYQIQDAQKWAGISFIRDTPSITQSRKLNSLDGFSNNITARVSYLTNNN